jgi:hypothetical protein
MMSPPPVPSYQEMLSKDLVETWEERAAVMEYEGRLPRDEAEWHAFLCVQGVVPDDPVPCFPLLVSPLRCPW